MSSGGINVRQPIIGAPPTNVGVAPGMSQPSLGPVSGQQVVDPSMAPVAASGQASAPLGAAAWSDGWAKAFKDAGASSSIIQELTFTGAMGADEAKLQQMLTQVAGEVDTAIAQFAQEHPKEFQSLRNNPAVDRTMLAEFAAQVNGVEVPKAELAQAVDSMGKAPLKAMFDSMVRPMGKSMIAYNLIPGYGLFNLASIPLNDGIDPLAKYPMIDSPLAIGGTALTAMGGAWTVANHIKVGRQVSQAHTMVAAGGDAGTVAANGGVDALTTMQKLKSYLPATRENKLFAGISRLDDLKAGIAQLSGIEKEAAQSVYDKIIKGEISLLGDPASKWGKIGYQVNTRGMMLGRNKAAAVTGIAEGKPFIAFDGRSTSKLMAADLARLGTEHADNTAANGMLRNRLFGALDKTDAAMVKNVGDNLYARASTQLFDSTAIARPQGVQKLFGALRPGPLQDAARAADNLAAGTVGKVSGLARIPTMAKFGIGGLIAAGIGYFAIIKPGRDAAKEAAEGQAAGQPTPEQQAALEQFAAMPKDQQAQIIQQQTATIQQASQQPNLTAEQQQQITAASAELQMMVEVAGGGAGAGVAPTGGMPAAATAATAATSAGALASGAAPAFTAQGLGLG